MTIQAGISLQQAQEDRLRSADVAANLRRIADEIEAGKAWSLDMRNPDPFEPFALSFDSPRWEYSVVVDTSQKAPWRERVRPLRRSKP